MSSCISPCGMICQQSFWKLFCPIPFMQMHSFGKNCFNYFVGIFNLSIGLWMIWSWPSMFDFVFLHYLLYQIGCKLSALICHNFPWDTKTSENILKKKWNYNIFSSRRKCFSFYPFCDIICTNKNIPFCLDGGLIGPTKYRAHFSKGSISTWGYKGISSEETCFPVLWQLSHLLTYSLASLKREGQ